MREKVKERERERVRFEKNACVVVECGTFAACVVLSLWSDTIIIMVIIFIYGTYMQWT